MTAYRAAWCALAALTWLIMASMAYLWMAGLLHSPHINPWTRPFQWLVYARLFGRSGAEQVYVIASALAAAAPFGGYLRYKAMRPKLRPSRANEAPPPMTRAHSDLYGHADWMPEKRLNQLASIPLPDHGGVVYGAACRADLHPSQDGGYALLLVDPCLEDATHGHVFVGSGGGKTSGYVVPTLDPEAGWRGNVLVNDPSSQAGAMCAQMRRDAGQRVVYIGLPRPLNPRQNPDLPPEPPRVGINLFKWINPSDPLFEEHVRSTIASLGPEKSEKLETDGNKMFTVKSEDLQVCLLADLLSDPNVPPSDKTPARLIKIAYTPEHNMKGLLETIYRESPSELARLLAGALMRVHPKTFSGFCADATADLSWLTTRSYADLVSGTASGSISPADFTHGDICVFLQLGVRTMEDTPQIGRAILNSLLNDIYRADGATGCKYLLLMDEINLFGKLKTLATVASQGRKYGVTLVGFWHSLNQMTDTWDKDGAETWRANASWEAYSAMNAATAKDVSERCGTYTVLAPSQGSNTSRQRGMSQGTRSRGTNETTSLQPRKLLTADEAERSLRKDEQIVFKRGEAHPIRTLKAYYFRRPDMNLKVQPDPYRKTT